jgi:hypothetical protein
MVDRPQSGPGWKAESNDRVVVDGVLYTGMRRSVSGGGPGSRDMAITVKNKTLYFQDDTPWDKVVEQIRLAVEAQGTPIYLAQENYDLTEGKGGWKTLGYFTDPEKAVERVKGRGVMGVGDGQVVVVKLDTGNARQETFYGYRQNAAGKWGYGYVDGRDDPVLQDPELPEYLRLKKKFEGKV